MDYDSRGLIVLETGHFIALGFDFRIKLALNDLGSRSCGLDVSLDDDPGIPIFFFWSELSCTTGQPS